MGVAVSVRDVTERKEAEEKIRFQAQLLGAVGEAVVALDMDGRVVYWNRPAEQMYGWSAEEMMGHRLREMVVPEDLRGRAEEIMWEVAAGSTWSGEFVLSRRDGTRFIVEATNTPVFGEDGALRSVISVLRDVTEIKETVKRLSRQPPRSPSNPSSPCSLMAMDASSRRIFSAEVQREESPPPSG